MVPTVLHVAILNIAVLIVLDVPYEWEFDVLGKSTLDAVGLDVLKIGVLRFSAILIWFSTCCM